MASLIESFSKCSKFTYEYSEEVSLDTLESNMSKLEHREIQKIQKRSVGFLICDNINNLYLKSVGDYFLFTVFIQNKNIEKLRLNRRINSLKTKYAKEGKEVTEDDITDQAKSQLLETTTPKEKLVAAYISLDMKTIYIDSTSAADAKVINSLIGRAIEGKGVGDESELEFTKENSHDDLSFLFTSWLHRDSGVDLPDGFEYGNKCNLKAEESGTAALSDHELESSEVEVHLEHGKKCQSVSLIFDDVIEFSLNKKGDVSAINIRESDDVEEDGADDGQDILSISERMREVSILARLFDGLKCLEGGEDELEQADL